jgi:hypothetical protein
MATPLLGWIAPQDRTQEQEDAHQRALAKMPKFAAAGLAEPTGPVKIILTDAWKHPKVVADIGCEFTGFHQLTGSCVGASEGDAVGTLAFVQRLLNQGATKAFIPFWPFPYGRTRLAEGDRGQGEGAVDSVMGDTLGKEGVFEITQPGLPAFKTDDGFYLTESIEMQWSDGARIDQKWLDIAKAYPLGTHAPLANVNDIKLAICNGYPVLDGCNNFVGHGSVKGDGKDAYVVGHYDGAGGHSTCILGYWDHPNDGPLYLYSNQWPTDTYPKDPAGAGRCCVWLKESTMSQLFRNGGDNGETMLLSHLNYVPAQPDVPAVFSWD